MREIMEGQGLNNKLSKINLRSEEFNEIMGVPPRWIVRWGITIIFIVIAVIFAGSAFFRYPDIINAPAVITSENPPSVIISKANGKLTDILFTEGSSVKRGDTIAVIENPARLSDIKILSRLMRGFDPRTDSQETLGVIKNYNKLQLGELQNQFNTFSRACSDYQLFLKQNYHDLKVKSLEAEYSQHKLYYSRLLSQKELTEKDIVLTQSQLTRDSGLYKSNAIALVDYERSQAVLLSKRQLLESAKLNLTNTSITISKLEQSISDIKFDKVTQTNKLKEDLLNSFNELISSLSTWEKTYLLIAPSSGKLTYMNVWSNLQEVKSGERLFTINPGSKGEIFAMVTIPFEGVGKVSPGENVNIKLDGYPYMEYGIVEGTLQSVSSGSTDKGFPAIVHLTNGAVTSYGQELSFERDLSGIAEINTKELTLLQRLFSPLRYIFNNKIARKQTR
jgi:multidrug efflux pump subunit AcrA (membrane-fusion protein)